SAELVRLGEPVLSAARKALAGKPSAEVRRRLEDVVEQVAGRAASPDARAAMRAVEVLERAGTPEARALLKELAEGVPEATLTGEARATLGRLGTRGATP
ncbi:MAG TPA: hypothetical protein VFW33_01185, partial [Gemmataceae bacterium]|nr:hypothetical protein [Gemmataceae bacterium]